MKEKVNNQVLFDKVCGATVVAGLQPTHMCTAEVPE
jgi:hypothetical protein